MPLETTAAAPARSPSWRAAPRVSCTQWGGQGPPHSLKCLVFAGCQSRDAKIGRPAASKSAMYRVSTGTTPSPRATASEPPGQKSYWTSTSKSAAFSTASSGLAVDGDGLLGEVGGDVLDHPAD